MSHRMIRIVNLPLHYTEDNLIDLLLYKVKSSNIKAIYLRHCQNKNLKYAYVIFTSENYSTAVKSFYNRYNLGGFNLNIEILGPDLAFQRFSSNAYQVIPLKSKKENYFTQTSCNREKREEKQSTPGIPLLDYPKQSRGTNQNFARNGNQFGNHTVHKTIENPILERGPTAQLGNRLFAQNPINSFQSNYQNQNNQNRKSNQIFAQPPINSVQLNPQNQNNQNRKSNWLNNNKEANNQSGDKREKTYKREKRAINKNIVGSSGTSNLVNHKQDSFKKLADVKSSIKRETTSTSNKTNLSANNPISLQEGNSNRISVKTEPTSMRENGEIDITIIAGSSGTSNLVKDNNSSLRRRNNNSISRSSQAASLFLPRHSFKKSTDKDVKSSTNQERTSTATKTNSSANSTFSSQAGNSTSFRKSFYTEPKVQNPNPSAPPIKKTEKKLYPGLEKYFRESHQGSSHADLDAKIDAMTAQRKKPPKENSQSLYPNLDYYRSIGKAEVTLKRYSSLYPNLAKIAIETGVEVKTGNKESGKDNKNCVLQ